MVAAGALKPREFRVPRGDPSMSAILCCCGVCALGVTLSAVPAGVDKAGETNRPSAVAGGVDRTGEANRELALTWFVLVGEADGVVWRRAEGEPGDSGRAKGERRVDVNPPPSEADLEWLAGRAWIAMAIS